MSDFIDDFERRVNAEAAEIRDRDEKMEEEELREEKARLDLIHRTEIAKRRSIEERKDTLDWAWVAANLLKEEGVLPAHMMYTKKVTFFTRREIKGISAEGFPLVGWQNNRYHPVEAHTLFLSARDDEDSGVHLAYSTQNPSPSDPTPEVRPEDVHVLPKEPLSETDMPWPIGVEDPWEIEPFISTEVFDFRKEMVNIFSDLDAPYRDIPEIVAPEFRAPGERDYAAYRKSGIEKSVRIAIARTAAQHLVINPEKMARTIQTRIALGIERPQ